MEISKNDLLQEMRSHLREMSPFQAERTQSIKNAAGMDFSHAMAQAIGHVNQLQANSKDLATRLDMGDTTVTLSDTVIAREKASVAFAATMEVRNKFIEAYQSIMNMPV